MLDPSVITNLATAYWGSMVLLSANRLEIFTALAAGPLTAAEVAQKCATHPHSTEMLLNACAGQSLLVKENGRYGNTPVVQTFLTRGTPAFLGDALRYAEDLYPVWGGLKDAVVQNRPAVPPETILGEDKEKTRNFVLGMHNRAAGIAASMVQQIDLTGRRRMLDVGGGPGTYSVMLVRKTAGLHSRVMDLPAVVEIAKELIADQGCSDRVGVFAGDYTSTPFPQGNDVVLMSGMMHRETPESCRDLLRRAHEALEPGGLVVVADVFFEDENKTSPAFAGLFALTMMLTAENGGAHAKTEMARWMSEAGFANINVTPLPPPLPHVIISGERR